MIAITLNCLKLYTIIMGLKYLLTYSVVQDILIELK